MRIVHAVEYAVVDCFNSIWNWFGAVGWIRTLSWKADSVLTVELKMREELSESRDFSPLINL